mmetsp:Transcript_86266/g.241276  ORF Transcript_86266/g.241276 Transcript_86266/m.241276 type:complete len:213 (-) Transcript_86266:766-1404(-)
MTLSVLPTEFEEDCVANQRLRNDEVVRENAHRHVVNVFMLRDIAVLAATRLELHTKIDRLGAVGRDVEGTDREISLFVVPDKTAELRHAHVSRPVQRPRFPRVERSRAVWFDPVRRLRRVVRVHHHRASGNIFRGITWLRERDADRHLLCGARARIEIGRHRHHLDHRRRANVPVHSVWYRVLGFLPERNKRHRTLALLNAINIQKDLWLGV